MLHGGEGACPNSPLRHRLHGHALIWGQMILLRWDDQSKQEISLLLPRRSVVATSLCVYIAGALPVSLCWSRGRWGGGGLTVTQVRPSGRRDEGQLSKHNHPVF